MSGLRLVAQQSQAMEDDQPHGVPGFPEAPGRKLMQEGQEIAQAAPKCGLGGRFLACHHALGGRLHQGFQIVSTLAKNVLEQRQIGLRETLFPDQLPGQKQALGLGTC